MAYRHFNQKALETVSMHRWLHGLTNAMRRLAIVQCAVALQVYRRTPPTPYDGSRGIGHRPLRHAMVDHPLASNDKKQSRWRTVEKNTRQHWGSP